MIDLCVCARHVGVHQSDRINCCSVNKFNQQSVSFVVKTSLRRNEEDGILKESEFVMYSVRSLLLDEEL